MNYYLVSYDSDKCEWLNSDNDRCEIICGTSKEEAMMIASKLFDCDSDILCVARKPVYTKKTKPLHKKLAKYHIKKSSLEQILNHLELFEEKFDDDDETCMSAGEKCEPHFFQQIRKSANRTFSLSVEYVFDQKETNVVFYVDYSGNIGSWNWDDNFEYDDETDLEYILRNAVCKYLDKNYSQSIMH